MREVFLRTLVFRCYTDTGVPLLPGHWCSVVTVPFLGMYGHLCPLYRYVWACIATHDFVCLSTLINRTGRVTWRLVSTLRPSRQVAIYHGDEMETLQDAFHDPLWSKRMLTRAGRGKRLDTVGYIISLLTYPGDDDRNITRRFPWPALVKANVDESGAWEASCNCLLHCTTLLLCHGDDPKAHRV